MKRAERTRRFFLLPFLIAAASAAIPVLLCLPASSSHAQKSQNEKLPKPRVLDKGIVWRRDIQTGEIEALTAASARESNSASIPAMPRAIVGQARIVPITCSVFASDGTPLRDLAAKDFRVYDDGVERPIEYFSAGANQPARVALVIDASPSVLPDSQEMKQAASALIEGLAPADEVAVVDFSAHTYLQTEFTGVRELLRRAVDRVDVRQLLGDVGGSNIYEAVYLTAHDLFSKMAGRKAIVLLTDGEDSGLGLTLDPSSASPRGREDDRLTFDDVTRELAAKDIQIFAVSTENRPRVMTRAWFAAHRDTAFLTQDARQAGIPAYTLYLAEIVRRSGGELYFLHEADTLAATFGQIAGQVGAEYTLGVPPAPGTNGAPHSGWHQLRVETVGAGETRVVHRAAYYVAPTP
jgi:VWFA-related protein